MNINRIICFELMIVFSLPRIIICLVLMIVFSLPRIQSLLHSLSKNSSFIVQYIAYNSFIVQFKSGLAGAEIGAFELF